MEHKNPVYLSKSDYTLALDCRTKLYYKKMHYPTITSEYMELLRAGGYMVGKIAQLLYDGIEIEFDGDVMKANDLTMKLLQENKNIFLYEATFFKDKFLDKVDVLEKTDTMMKIIEVKSSVYDSEKYKYGSKPFMTKYKEKLQDVAFQYFVLKKAFPDKSLNASLMMPDKNKLVTMDNLPTLFSIQKDENGRYYTVEYSGSTSDLRASNFLTEFDVTDIVISMQSEIEKTATEFLTDLISAQGIIKYKTPLNKTCRECEFRADTSDSRDGYRECWGKLAEVEPHVFDLYYMGTIGGTKEPLVNKLISEGKVSLYDIPESALLKERGKRQTIQLKNTKKNSEWVSEDLAKVMKSLEYPLYFIDFEASVLAVPYHRGMRAYEKVAFQWSCHKIKKPGQEPKHFEWINVNNIFPNFEFAEHLKNCIQDDGTVLIWTSYENTTLREIRDQIIKYGYENASLSEWLDNLIKTKESSHSRIVDMNDLTLRYYFHPLMKGKTSLKWVLPAVWQSDSKLYEYEFSKKYYKKENGRILEPYETLPKIDIAEQAEVVKEGTGAMMAYQEMLYGLAKNNPEIRERWKNLLLQYCELDTAAMVLIWKHWENFLNLNH
jgi:hypothetical protein